MASNKQIEANRAKRKEEHRAHILCNADLRNPNYALHGFVLSLQMRSKFLTIADGV